MPRRPAPSTRKTIFDPVHGQISLDGASLALIGTPEFQRLWGIRQTGFAHLVFPGANHTRLEHSLGTFWVAIRMAERLGLDPARSETIGLSALLHDLGHPPFSHTLEPSLREVTGSGHESISRQRIEGTEPLDGRDASEIPAILERFGHRPRAIADLVDPPSARESAPLLRSMLHGSVDVDRIDYLQRDAHYTGVAHGTIDAVRLLDTVRASRTGIAFAEKGRSAVEGFLVGRSLMYSSVYYHKTVRAAELMAQAALERLPVYPEQARPLLAGTDGELQTRLGDAGGTSARLVRRILARHLHKSARAWPTLSPSRRRAWRRLLAHPVERRAVEDRLAERLGGEAGDVAFDLASLERRDGPVEDGRAIPIVGPGGTTFPFRGRSSPWGDLATRPPARWEVAVYTAPRLRSAAERLLSSGRFLPA